LRTLTDTELNNLNTKFVREQVGEKVEVILTYDKATETFWYYTDQLKEVSYDILETVARKFAIDYDCKMICLDQQAQAEQQQAEQQQAEQQQAEQQQAEQQQAEQQQAEQQQAEQPPAPSQSVFVKFKKYNTGGKGASSNFTSVVKVVEQMNHFRYRGKIYDYEESFEKKKGVIEEPLLDYASFKKLLENKEK
jgi:DNA polymerase III alpha subunit (gram-positive type)